MTQGAARTEGARFGQRRRFYTPAKPPPHATRRTRRGPRGVVLSVLGPPRPPAPTSPAGGSSGSRRRAAWRLPRDPAARTRLARAVSRPRCPEVCPRVVSSGFFLFICRVEFRPTIAAQFIFVHSPLGDLGFLPASGSRRRCICGHALCGYCVSSLLGKYRGAQRLGHVAGVCSTLAEATGPRCKAVEPCAPPHQQGASLPVELAGVLGQGRIRGTSQASAEEVPKGPRRPRGTARLGLEERAVFRRPRPASQARQALGRDGVEGRAVRTTVIPTVLPVPP